MTAPHSIYDTAPADRWEDAFLSGNGEYGIMVFGNPHAERVVFNHHRFVLPNGSRSLRPPAVAHRLERVRDLILAGERKAAQREFSDGRPLSWTQPFHPGFAMSLDTIEAGCVRDYRRVVDFSTGVVTVSWSDGTAAWTRRSFVSRADAVVVQELLGPAQHIRVRLSGDLPGRPADVRYRATATVATAERAVLSIVGRYPNGLGAAGFEGVTMAVVDGGTMTADSDTVVVRGARRVLLLSKMDRSGEPNATQALETSLAALPTDYAALLERHTAIHSPIYGRVELDLDVDPVDRNRPVSDLIAAQNGDRAVIHPALLERMFHSGRYLLLSSSGVLPPRLTGLWLGAWAAAWSGDYTTDANVNLQLAAANIGGMPEVIAGYTDFIRRQIKDWQVNAQDIYGARGILAPSRTDGESGYLFHLDDEWPWAMWIAGADWLLFPMYEHWQVTGDERFLADVLAPLLVQAAVFFEDFLTRTDAAGQVIFVPSYSPEVGPAGADGVAAVNATMDIAAGRHALSAAVEVCQYLGTQSTAVLRWQELLKRLPPYRIVDGALAEWAWPGLPTNEDHRHVSHLYPAWPLHDITPDDTPELAIAALRALGSRGDENLSAHGSLHRALASARLKDAELAYANLRKILGNDMVFRSLMTSHNPDLDIYNADAAHTLPAVLIEMLVDSRPGVVELLPALPQQLPRGTIRGIAGRGQVSIDELTWDLHRGTAHATMRSSSADRTVTVICRRAVGELQGGWRFVLVADRPVTITLRLAAAKPHNEPWSWRSNPTTGSS